MLSDIGPPQHVWLIVGDSRAMLPCEGLLAKPRWNGVFPWPRPIARGEDFVSKIVFPARNVRFVHVSFSDIEKYILAISDFRIAVVSDRLFLVESGNSRY